MTTTLDSAGGLFTEDGTRYQAEHRIYPTDHYRSVETDVVETGTYRVAVDVESPEAVATDDPYTTTWRPADCRQQELIVTVTGDVEFSQREC